ncbi:hypothetical protein ACHAXS_012480 [Conticribra weissflogii]
MIPRVFGIVLIILIAEPVIIVGFRRPCTLSIPIELIRLLILGNILIHACFVLSVWIVQRIGMSIKIHSSRRRRICIEEVVIVGIVFAC